MSRIIGYEPCPKCRRNYRDTRGDNLAVYEDGGKHCFACKYHEFPKHYIPRKEVEYVPKSLRPADYTREVPAVALQWLLQYGIPWKYWQPSLGYSPKECRLVFSVGEPLAFSIGRYIEDDPNNRSEALRPGRVPTVYGTETYQRGYDNQSDPPKQVRKWFVWGDCHKHTEAIRGPGEHIVLVEDLISAHKVALSGAVYEAIPLFGTKIYPCHIHHLINGSSSERHPVVLWLDKDQEMNVKKQAWQLESVINRPVKVITTEQDPKELDFEVLRLHCNC